MMDFMQLFGHHIPETRARGTSPIPRAHKVFFFAVPTSRIVSRFNLAGIYEISANEGEGTEPDSAGT